LPPSVLGPLLCAKPQNRPLSKLNTGGMRSCYAAGNNMTIIDVCSCVVLKSFVSKIPA